MENVTLFGALIAGVLSFVSPCVLPLIPGYLSYISGVSLEEMRGMSGGAVAARPSPAAQRQVIVTYLGSFLMQRLTLLGKIAGVLIIIFGLHTMGVFKIESWQPSSRWRRRRKPSAKASGCWPSIRSASPSRSC